MRAVVASALVVVAALHTASARADVDVRVLARALADVSISPSSRWARPLSASVRLPPASRLTSPPGVSLVAPALGVVRAPLADLIRLGDAHPDWTLSWAPPRRLLLDHVGESTGAIAFRNETGGTGRGVYVGIVDTGVDVLHPDLRNADGTTRVAWFLDFSRSRQNLHPEVEDRCDEAGLECAAYRQDDLDALILDGGARLPDDDSGHGTHVASLAAGNGLSSDGRFTGMAPEAELVIARVTGATEAIDDTDVLKAVELIYWLGGEYAESIGEPTHPTVVNMSLGSDFGPHDGNSVLGAGLAEMVGRDHPGRALVLAAGNSAGLLHGFENFPEPLGVHTEVDVPYGSSVRVPLVTPFPRNGSATTNASVSVWIDFMPGDDLAIGFEGPERTLLSPVPFGQGRAARHDELEIAVINGTTESEKPTKDAHSAVLLLDGRWRAGTTFALRLSGHGTAGLWAQSEGDLAPEAGSIGALFPRASKESTINIPAAHPDLIAVGATVNRLEWTDRAGDSIRVVDPDEETPVGSVSYFSSAGPTFDGAIKPDLLAPGEYVIGAMARRADPATNRFSIFAGSSACDGDRQCAVVDDDHGVISGTSMASPIVAGAVALLFEQDPTLSQPEVRALLQAGSKPPEGSENNSRQVGAGALDLAMTRRVLDARTTPVERAPAAENSRLVVADRYARPDSDARLDALLVLRDDRGDVADGFDERLLRVSAENGTVVVPLRREAPGLWRFGVSANDRAGGRSLVVSARYDRALLAAVALPVAADAAVAQSGFAARGGCALASSRPRGALWVWAVAVAIVAALASRSARR